ncbi:unnamed protein product [Ectocarpus sp. 12 AP-2014]
MGFRDHPPGEEVVGIFTETPKTVQDIPHLETYTFDTSTTSWRSSYGKPPLLIDLGHFTIYRRQPWGASVHAQLWRIEVTRGLACLLHPAYQTQNMKCVVTTASRSVT